MFLLINVTSIVHISLSSNLLVKDINEPKVISYLSINLLTVLKSNKSLHKFVKGKIRWFLWSDFLFV